MNSIAILLPTLTYQEQSTLSIMRKALADLEGIMPEFEPSGYREHPGWITINELKIGIAKLSGNWRILWDELGDTPVNEDEVIDKDFLFFIAGTDVHDIWYWFEETFNISIGKIMHGDLTE